MVKLDTVIAENIAAAPIDNHVVSLINKFFYTKISTFVRAFYSLNYKHHKQCA